MIQINLLPDIKVVYLKIRRLRLIVFLVALFVITICTISLLLMGFTTLVQQKNDILSHRDAINAYVADFNSEEGRDIRRYLAIQGKFQSLSQLEDQKLDVNRIWANGLFGGQTTFLPAHFLETIELYDFNFETGEFTISGEVEESGDDIDFRNYFVYAYYEIAELDEKGQVVGWGCPLARQDSFGNAPAWTYCPMFSGIEDGYSSEFQPELDAKRTVTINGLFTTEVPGAGINLFDEDVRFRVRGPSGCADPSCVTQPDPGENEPQDLVNSGQQPS